MYCYNLCPQPCSRPPLTHAFAGDSRTATGKSPVGSLFLSPGSLVHKILLCLPRVYFPVLCKFWQLYTGVDGGLLQEDLCHTDTQSPCPCGRPLLTHSSTGDALSSVSVSVESLGPGAHKVCLQLAPRLRLTGATRNVLYCL